MNALRLTHASFKRLSVLAAVACFCLSLSACMGLSSDPEPYPDRTAPKGGSSGVKQLAYGVSITPAANWQVASTVSAEAATKASLDTRRQGGERILLFETASAPSPRGIQSMLGVFLVNQDNTFMPLEFAEKLKPEEFAAMSRDLFEREKQLAKKNKARSGLMELQVSRDTVGGKLAILQRMLMAGPDGKPLRLINWDIYLPNGAGIAVKTVIDPESPGAEAEAQNMVRSLRFQ